MSAERMRVRGVTISVDHVNVGPSGGPKYPYLRARIPLGVDPFTHKARPAKVKTARTMEELQAKVLEVLDVRARLGGIEESKVTVAEWCEYYLDHYLRGSLSTQERMTSDCRKHIIPYLGELYLQELTESQVEDFRDHLTREEGLAPATVGNLISSLSMILDRAVHMRAIPFNPASMVRKPRRDYKRREALSKEQTAAFLEEIKSDRYGNLLGLLVTTGFRVGEGEGLAVSRVDMAHRRITVDQHVITAKVGNRYRTILVPSTKTGVNRTIDVPRQALEYVQTELEARRVRERSAGSAWSNPHDLVFVGNGGGILTYKTVNTHIKRIGARIGRPDLTPHILRHTAATMLYLRSHNIIWVRDMLGHLDLATTERYVHVSTSDLQTIPVHHAREMERIHRAEIPVDLDFEGLEF